MARGANAPVGKQMTSQNGYLYVKTEEGWKSVHRQIAEQKLGRPLNANERVTFVNGNKLDVRPENLIITKVKTGIDKLKKRREALVIRIEELQAQLADLEDDIHRQELRELS